MLLKQSLVDIEVGEANLKQALEILLHLLILKLVNLAKVSHFGGHFLGNRRRNLLWLIGNLNKDALFDSRSNCDNIAGQFLTETSIVVLRLVVSLQAEKGGVAAFLRGSLKVQSDFNVVAGSNRVRDHKVGVEAEIVTGSLAEGSASGPRNIAIVSESPSF